MKDKNLPNDIKNKSLNELTELANNIIKNLEFKKDLENSMSEYQRLIQLSNIIEKKFQSTSKQISETTKLKISQILNKKNEKKTK
jgi:exonuclease VII small subunit